MLRIGFVGKEYFHLYFNEVVTNNRFKCMGVFDPSFQFEIPKSIPEQHCFLSFEKLIYSCDAVIFSSGDKIYLPLIEMAIRKSKAVFLHGAHNFSLHELSSLQHLNEEADTTLQIQHPFVFHEAFDDFKKQKQIPMLIESESLGIADVNLLPFIKDQVLAIFCISSANIRKITANPIASFSEIPDILKVRIDFSNGCIADIHVNSIEKEQSHKIKSFNLNSFTEIDFLSNRVHFQNRANALNQEYHPDKNTQHAIISRQLSDFYNNVINQHTPIISIEKQIHTQIVVAKIKEKLRLCINL